jgi:hypothetical protein
MTKPVTLVRVDHGMGGPCDATREDVATFDDWRDAVRLLRERGYSVDFDGHEIPTHTPPRRQSFYHVDPQWRHCMGCITYEFRDLPEPPPHNRLPDHASFNRTKLAPPTPPPE